jgi:crossover junction endodeoxyribonuclease RuvC
MFDIDVLGVDPGLARLGLAVLSRKGRATSVVWSDTVRTPPDLDEPSRLLAVASAVRDAILRFDPAAIAVERVAFNRNVVSALPVAMATGAIMVAAAEAGIAVRGYTPTEVKSAITGSGGADKEQIRSALTRIHGLSGVPSQPDAADAAAVALTFINGAGLRRSAARAGAT